MKTPILLFLILLSGIVFGQRKFLDSYNAYIYFSGNGDAGGDGGIENPYESYDDFAGNEADSICLFFERGTTTYNYEDIHFGDRSYMHVRAYGSGSLPVYKCTRTSNNKMITFTNSNNCILDSIDIQGYDIASSDMLVEFYEGGTTDPPEPVQYIDSITISNCKFWGGNVAIALQHDTSGYAAKLVYNRNIWIMDNEFSYQDVDCILPRDVDSIHVWRNNVHHINQKWHNETHDESAGGDIIQTDWQVNYIGLIGNIFDRRNEGNKYDVLIANGEFQDQYAHIEGNTFYAPKDTVGIGSLEFTGTLNDLEFEDVYSVPRGEHAESDSSWWYAVEIQSIGTTDVMRYSVDDEVSWYESSINVSTDWIPIGMEVHKYVDQHQSSFEVSEGDLYDTTDMRINIRFGAITGHSVGDKWYFKVSSDDADKGGAILTLQGGTGNGGINTAYIARNKFIGRVTGTTAHSTQAALDCRWHIQRWHYNEFDSINHNKGANQITFECQYLEFFNNSIVPGSDIYSVNALYIGADSGYVKNNLVGANTWGDALNTNDMDWVEESNNTIVETDVSAEIDSGLGTTNWETSDLTRVSNENDGVWVGIDSDIVGTPVYNPPDRGAYEFEDDAPSTSNTLQSSGGKLLKTTNNKLIK